MKCFETHGTQGLEGWQMYNNPIFGNSCILKQIACRKFIFIFIAE